MTSLELLEKEVFEKFGIKSPEYRTCRYCGKEAFISYDSYLCDTCKLEIMRIEEERYKRDSQAYKDGQKDAAQYIVDLLYTDESYTDNYFDLPKFEDMIIKHFGLEVEECLG
jgi:hypothetical protein